MPRDEKEEILHYLRIVSGNRITLPEDLREALGIEIGDYLRAELRFNDRKVVLEPAA